MIQKKKFNLVKSLLFVFTIVFFMSCGEENPLTAEALNKIDKLESLMDKAQSKSIDVTREETTLWFAKEFLKFADYDEAHKEDVEKLFGYYAPLSADKKKTAEELPDFERGKVIEILDKSINDLEQLIAGKRTRRPVSKVDWENIEVAKDMFLSHGKPVFLYDYFSKTVGKQLTNKSVYNDHLGNIYHGGQRLYDTNMDRAINPYILNEDGTFNEKIDLITEIPDTNVGFLYYWSMGIPEWVEKKEPEVRVGRSLFTGFDIDNPNTVSLSRYVYDNMSKTCKEVCEGTSCKLTFEEELTTEEIISRIKDGHLDAAIAATPLEDDVIKERVLYFEPFVGVHASSNILNILFPLFFFNS